jgi:hypothetical protein
LPPIIVNEKKDYAPQPQEALSIKKTSKVIKLDNLKTANTSDNIISEANRVTPEKKSILKVSLNENSLKSVWEEIANDFKEKKPGVTNLMLLYFPIIEAGEIQVSVESAVQQTIFSEQWEVIERIITERFEDAPNIKLFMQSNNDNSKKKLFGPQEKLKRLIEINPAIMNFSKEMGLDFDY